MKSIRQADLTAGVKILDKYYCSLFSTLFLIVTHKHLLMLLNKAAGELRRVTLSLLP